MLTVKNWGYLAALGHFEIVAAENGDKRKSGISITQPLLLTVLPYLPQMIVSEGGKYQELGKNILICNDRFSKFKMAPNYGQYEVLILHLCKMRVSMTVATKVVCVTLIPLGNIYHQFNHAKTNIFKWYVPVNDKLGC